MCLISSSVWECPGSYRRPSSAQAVRSRSTVKVSSMFLFTHTSVNRITGLCHGESTQSLSCLSIRVIRDQREIHFHQLTSGMFLSHTNIV